MGILYLESAICGYCAYGREIETANIIELFKTEDIGKGLYYLVCICFSFVCISSVPVNFFESRNVLLSFYCEILDKFTKKNTLSTLK